jgi:hypothetical protein
MVTDIYDAHKFISEVGGYPVFAKPDTGVGAADTFKIENYKDLVRFFDKKPDVQYIMEEYIFGDIYSYDAICDSEGEPLFESSFMCPNVADTVNEDQEMMYFVLPDVPDQLREYGRKALKGFNVHHHDDSQILERYGDAVKLHGRMPDVLADAMGNQMYTAVFATIEEVDGFITFVQEHA